MKKVKHFFNFLEERIILRFGRRIWQIIGLFSIVALIFSIAVVIVNLFPTERKEIHISKKEFKENKIDRDFDESNNIDPCMNSDYKRSLDSLKAEMPSSEWNKLTTPMEVTKYREVERYDPWYGSYTEYEEYTAFEEVKNEDAIPNILDNIYNDKNIDSVDFCDKIEVVRAVTALMKQTKKSIATNALKDNYLWLLSYNDLTKQDVERSINLFNTVTGKKPFVVKPSDSKDPWNYFENYLQVYSQDSITVEREEIAVKVAKQLKVKGIKKDENRHRVILGILKLTHDDEATESACDEFFFSSNFRYNDKNFLKQVNKYFYLFEQKLAVAEELKAEEESEKKSKIELYGSSSILSFGIILAIASILILYSIRQILKDKNS